MLSTPQDRSGADDTHGQQSDHKQHRVFGLRGRRRARVLAFQALYEADVAKHKPGEVLRRLATEQQVEPDVWEYATELVGGVLRRRPELDRIIQQRAPAWPLSQMSPVDRNILRIGLYECLFSGGKVPIRAAINEAVELAKIFGSESSPRFVNGVLGQVVASLAQQPTANASETQ